MHKKAAKAAAEALEAEKDRAGSLAEERGLSCCLKSDASASWDPCAFFLLPCGLMCASAARSC